MDRILIASPIRQDPEILAEFFQSLSELDTAGFSVDYAFIDDNVNPLSKKLVERFSPRSGEVFLFNGWINSGDYHKNEQGHLWNEELIWKVARYKDALIALSKERAYDGLFFVDSDLVLHPQTLLRLRATSLDIVSEVFWTRWPGFVSELPQVWVQDQYSLHRADRQRELRSEEILELSNQFVTKLREPGLYEVGGLGACTLISKRAIDKGVSFAEIPNLSFSGEDRHFCVRAQALGLKLYADTYYPPLHLYTRDELQRVSEFKKTYQYRRDLIDSLGVFRDGIEAWGAVHYLVEPKDLSDYFSLELVRQFHDLRESEKDEILRSESFSRIKVREVIYHQKLDSDSFKFKAKTIQWGMENNQEFRDDNQVEAIISRTQDGWRIRAWNWERSQPLNEPYPLVRKTRNSTVCVSMLVHNEADRYLPRVLEQIRLYADAVLIIDDNSTDNSAELCEDFLQGIPHLIVRLEKSLFGEEWKLRRIQWQISTLMKTDWIIPLDADQLFENNFKEHLESAINQDDCDVLGVRLFDMWSETHYREDEYWNAHNGSWRLLARNNPEISQEWQQTAQHCGSFPRKVFHLPILQSPLRLKHLGWATESERVRKFERYQRLDPDGKWGDMVQYRSILDPRPHLVPWVE